MTNDFCTLFDVNYLPRGLALYRSLERACRDFRLWIFCMDDTTLEALRALDLPAAELVSLSTLEEHDPALRSTRAKRTAVEYCWTATPAVCRYVLESSGAAAVTYVDADVLFFSDPEPLFDELGSDAVMIVPHRYAPEYRHKEPETGTFNVQWTTFRRDPDGLATLAWWHAQCIEWCYHRWEDGKIGDQGYLNEFPRLFNRVHVLEHPGGGLAPWNVSAHDLAERDGMPTVDGRPLVFYHFHSLRLYGPGVATTTARLAGRARTSVTGTRWAWRTNYEIRDDELRLVWGPYLRALAAAEHELARAAPRVEVRPPAFPASELARSAARVVRRRLTLPAARIRARLPGALERHRESWQSAAVAQQMRALTESQLEDPDDVAPYVAFRHLLAALVADPALPPQARFLDLGCGVGAYGDLLERYAPGRFEYVGADFSEEILRVARERASSRSFERRDIYEPGSVDGFDVVLASALVDVLPDPDSALRILLGSDARWLILHRQRVGAHGGVDVVRGYSGQTTYRSTVSAEALDDLARACGRRLKAEVPVQDDIRSFLFEREPC